MKKHLPILLLCCILILNGCASQAPSAKVVASTRPVYDFTTALCSGTDITVELLVTESLSCLHDYTLQVRQMRAVENAELVVLSGAGLETFLEDALSNASAIIDASTGVPLLCGPHEHGHDAHSSNSHTHEQDPHIWLSIPNARIMTENILNGLIAQYPKYETNFLTNYRALLSELDTLEAYGAASFSQLSSYDLITFHDGFAYFAECYGLNILHSLEEESGSEASAEELKELIMLVRDHEIRAIFTEENGSTAAAKIVSAETGASVYRLNMAMSEMSYFDAMYHNIYTIKEALE